MQSETTLSTIIKHPGPSLGCMGVLCLMVGACAFGSGSVLQGWTGIDFHLTDLIVTLVGGPVLFVIVLVIQEISQRGLADRRLQRAVRKQLRFQSWTSLLPLLESGTGTLIVEVINFGPGVGMNWRVWWTSENVAQLAPGQIYQGRPIVSRGESDYVDWVYDRYLDEAKGLAILTDPDLELDNFYPELPDELLAPFRASLPNLSIVALPMRDAELQLPIDETAFIEQNHRLREWAISLERYRDWQDLLPALQSGDGTLIIEAKPLGLGTRLHWRIWWTRENVAEMSPEKKPTKYDAHHRWEDRFAKWCHRRYLDRLNGLAMLTTTPVKRFGVGQHREALQLPADPFKRLFPRMTVVVVPMSNDVS